MVYNLTEILLSYLFMTVKRKNEEREKEELKFHICPNVPHHVIFLALSNPFIRIVFSSKNF